ncbi:kinase-like domain-containing protein [Rhizoctonia solani]|nr:kinase-like domain-containing protein [Rhizoctonia solani]
MFSKFKELVFGPSKETVWLAEIAQTKQEFHDLVGPMHNQTPLAVKRSNHSPNPSSASLTPSRTPEPPTAGPSGATLSPPADTPPQPQLLATGSVPVHTLSDVKSTLRNVIGIIPTSSLQDEMKDLYGCCLVLINLLEKSDPSVDSAPHYSYIFSKMQQDLNDITQFISDWMKKKSTVQHMQRKDIHIQVQTLEDIFTRHLTVFIALSQSESTTSMNKEFAELQAKMGSIQIHARDSRNTEQVAPGVLQEQVRLITGHSANAEWILTGKISYREAVTVSQGRTFDVYKGRLNDGETVAIKLLRQKLKNDGTGRIMRQVQLWTLFSSPFILECRGIGMQMTMSEDDDYDKFQFYLVSPFIKRGDAVHYIKKMRKQGAFVDILKYLRDAARGIQYLHCRKPPCVHASIRGENVLIKDDGTACLNGFGLTKAFTVGKLIELTGDNRQYHWMAPELLGKDKPPLDPSCDIWAWAMTALELITEKQPYYNVVQWDLMDHVVKQGKRPERTDYPTFNEQNCPQPDMMWALLQKCWTDASERYTIEQVIDDLENIEKVQIEQQTTHVWT